MSIEKLNFMGQNYGIISPTGNTAFAVIGTNKKPLFDFTTRAYHTPGFGVERTQSDTKPAQAEEKPVEDNAAAATTAPAAEKAATKPTRPRGRNVSPKGWYRANNDLSSDVKGITIDNMKKAEEAGKSGATFVLERVLGTKMGNVLSEEDKARLLGEIIRKNPSVFDKNGFVKTDARIERLDVPSKAWLKEKYGVESNDKGQVKTKTSMKVLRGNNGYYAKQAGPGGWLYFNPQGKQITEDEFKKHCPTIHKNIKAKEVVDDLKKRFPFFGN